MEMIENGTECLSHFPRRIELSELPSQFNFPFYHSPHPLCVEAAEALQLYLQEQQDWRHNFGLDPEMKGLVIGKMFGVMLVETKSGAIGYLCAFSGKLANKNTHPHFVPPIFDMLKEDGFFLKGEAELNALNAAILALEQSKVFTEAKLNLSETQAAQDALIEKEKLKNKNNKERRKLQRADATFSLCEEGQEAVLEDLRLESIREQGLLRFLQKEAKRKIENAQAKLDAISATIEALKLERKEMSATLQEQLFAQYNFLNIEGERKNLKEIFAHTSLAQPPSGAGECAAPKLLQYAFLHEMKPLAFAEFWWGASPVSEIRKHGHFYPACRGKCEPILAHMLQGIDVEANPMLAQQHLGHRLSTVYEDEHIVVLNKPSELLSVPGKIEQTSVLEILQERYPHATGPLLVHRLDMATSGLLIAAKTKEAHQYLQSQFIKKTAKKSYVALVDGVLEENSGVINLPLRVDLDNRPHQIVCFEHGRAAVTEWEKLDEADGKTRLKLIPITGRTHQLRVHCAHQLGLNRPIIGDDLYGEKAERLYLHAHTLCIKHPVTRQVMDFVAPLPF